MADELAGGVREHWKDFVHTLEPLRGALYRYCRHLTRSPWDAEDLAQDTVARAFVTLAQLGETPPNAQAWLFRVASNLWIDQVRRARVAARVPEEPALATVDAREVREAGGTLLGRLSPQERAAVVLKDAFDLSLEEIADVLVTSVGAVKAALHRGRARLAEEPPEPMPARPAALDAFCEAFRAHDVERVAALLSDHAVVEVVGITTQYGRNAAKRTVLPGMMFGAQHLADALPVPPRQAVVAHRGEWLLLSWYQHPGNEELVRAVNRLGLADDGSVVRLRNYFFTPDLLAEVCAELGVPYRLNGYSFC